MAAACERDAEARRMADLRYRFRSTPLRRHEACEARHPYGFSEWSAVAQQERPFRADRPSRARQVCPATGRGFIGSSGSSTTRALSKHLGPPIDDLRPAREVAARADS